MLRLTTIIVIFLVWVPVAQAWSWPVQGPVLQPFAYDEAHPYAAGQHRGVDIGADSAGQNVVAPATGTISFAGSVPTSGESITIQTADGYSVTLTHLGSILVAKGGAVAEHDVVGTIGPSGAPEFDQPYVHLGVRTTSDPNGYLDPLSFLPPASSSAPTQSGSTASQPSTSGASTSTPAASSAPTAHTPVAGTQGSNVRKARTRVSSHGRSRTSRSATSGQARTQQGSARPASHPAHAGRHVPHHVRKLRRPVRARTSSVQRPVAEAAAPSRRGRLDTGHQLQPAPPVLQLARPSRASTVPLPLVLNGLAALVAVAAAFAAGRGRRRRPAGARVLRLARPRFDSELELHAA